MSQKTATAARAHYIVLALTIAFFLALTLPLAFKRPMGGRSSERQGFTAGIMRMYCFDPAHSIINGPQIHFGNNPFNIEWTGFEWAQAQVARAIDPGCDSVEPVGKLFSIFCSVIALLLIFSIGMIFGGETGAVIAVVTLACDELWTRYSTYTMIENRTLMLGLAAMLCSFKRKPWLAAVFWALTFVHKPQIFGVCLVFWLTSELLLKKHLPALGKKVFVGVGLALAVGFVWYGYGIRLAEQSDLPWIIHTGPKEKQWYFGNWSERFEWIYWKNQILTWVRMTGFVMTISVSLLFLWKRQTLDERKEWLQIITSFALPFLAAEVCYTFLFYNVFKAHEYYALPLNVIRSICLGWSFGFLIENAGEWLKGHAYHGFLSGLLATVLILFLIPPVIESSVKYNSFVESYNDPSHVDYQNAWDQNIFPKKHAFVAMAVYGYGKDLLHLYLAKQHGFVWCTENEKFAPRKYWKDQGVEYVAWARSIDDKQRVYKYEVRTIDEELKIAREKGWSSDLPGKDAWGAHSMAEWTRIASHLDKDPCRGTDFDPQKWQ